MDRKNTFVWSFYDFATTPVAFAVNAMYLPLMIIAMGGTNTTVGLLPLITGSVAAIWTPFVGVLIDRVRRRKIVRKLIVLLSVLFAGISILVLAHSINLESLLISFTTMSISIQSGWTAMNAYLASEGEDDKLGMLSGIGIVNGYIGGALGAGGALVIEILFNRELALVFVALFLMLFGIIPALFLEDKSEVNQQGLSMMSSLKEGGAVIKTNPSVRAYLVGSVLWGDAVSTIVTFGSLLAVEVLLIPEANATMFLAMALPAAIVGAYIQGKAGDKFGLIKLQRLNLILWVLGISIIIVGGGIIPNIIVASAAGFALGGNIALSRALYAKIIPEGMEGRLFGISAIFVFFGGAIGPLLTGIIADLPGVTLRIALFVPLLFVVASIPALNYIKE
ncbi:MAG: MFS transporter [Candidatus Thorarchaeota archaeon]